MVSSETDRVILPDVIRNVPGGGGILWRLSSKSILTAVGLLCRGFLHLQKNVRVDGMDNFLRILESERDRGVITGTWPFCDNTHDSI
jgi:hypothetical protein